MATTHKALEINMFSISGLASTLGLDGQLA